MAFLRLNGWAVPIQDGGAVRTNLRAGTLERSPRGKARTSSRDEVPRYAFTSCFHTNAEAEALIGLISGKGHAFRFEDGLQSHKGLQPEPNYTGVGLDVATAVNVTFDGFASITQGSLDLRYNAQLDDSTWTILWREYDGADWAICALTASGTGYVDGVATAGVGSTATALAPSTRDGVLLLAYSGSGTITRLADLVVLPYEITAGMAFGFYSLAFPFGPLPRLRASGDALSSQGAFYFGRVTGSSFVQGNLGGGWSNNLVQVSWELIESTRSGDPVLPTLGLSVANQVATTDLAFSYVPTISNGIAPYTFSLDGSSLPSWASFSTSTGYITGTPSVSDVGVTSGIIISVEDTTGRTATSAAFSIEVIEGTVYAEDFEAGSGW